jgi:hypothetical protein
VYASGSFMQTSPTSYDVDEQRGAAEFDRWLAEHDRKVAERVHDETVQVMDGLMPRGSTYVVPVNTYAKEAGK